VQPANAGSASIYLQIELTEVRRPGERFSVVARVCGVRLSDHVAAVRWCTTRRRCLTVLCVVGGPLRHTGWVDTWLETSADDPGRGMTQQAVADGVDLDLVAGGDGTVRIVADGLAHTGTPMG
jgi:hypothetical protein